MQKKLFITALIFLMLGSVAHAWSFHFTKERSWVWASNMGVETETNTAVRSIMAQGNFFKDGIKITETRTDRLPNTDRAEVYITTPTGPGLYSTEGFHAAHTDSNSLRSNSYAQAWQ